MSLYHSLTHTDTKDAIPKPSNMTLKLNLMLSFKKKLPTPHTDDFRNTKATFKECYLQKNSLLLFLTMSW